MESDTRLYGILARNTERGVILRRGPSRHVLCIGWDTARDRFEIGQWFLGRIYERRCDLSPDGSLLIYFAAKHRRPLFSWTAISKVPYLTALALWPKGDAWGGGGLFASSRQVLLNHREGERSLSDGFAVPRLMSVKPFGDGPGWGEDNPIWTARLLRDGWTFQSEGAPGAKNPKLSWEFSPPILYSKRHPISPKRYRLEMEIHGIHEKNGPWYLIEHAVVHGDEDVDTLGRSDWADWLPGGDLVFARGGQLCRLRYRNGVLSPSDQAEVIADFSALKFEAKEAPKKMQRW